MLCITVSKLVHSTKKAGFRSYPNITLVENNKPNPKSKCTNRIDIQEISMNQIASNTKTKPRSSPERQFPVRTLDFLIRSIASHPENFVRISPGIIRRIIGIRLLLRPRRREPRSRHLPPSTNDSLPELIPTP